jgi:hypothetical protein
MLAGRPRTNRSRADCDGAAEIPPAGRQGWIEDGPRPGHDARLLWLRSGCSADLVGVSESSRRPVAYLLVGVTAVAGFMAYAFQIERHVAVTAAERTDNAVSALTAMLDQETGMRGFLLTGREEFLQPYVSGRASFEQARVQVRAAAAGDHDSMRLAEAEDVMARSWQELAAGRIAARRSAGSGLPVARRKSPTASTSVNSPT